VKFEIKKRFDKVSVKNLRTEKTVLQFLIFSFYGGMMLLLGNCFFERLLL
jgi:hypothetical protein